MVIDNITLDQVREEEKFNLRTLYEVNDIESHEDHDSPFQQCNIDCEYYEPEDLNRVLLDKPCSTSYFHLNCRSLSSNWECFHDLLCDLHNEKFSFAFIGISEIFNCEKDPRLKLPGFHKLISRTRDDGNQGGVGLFIKKDVNFKIREDLCVFIPHIFESIFVEIQTKTKKKNIVGVIYRPNSQPKADIDIFVSTLYELMNIINNENNLCTLMGDFNIDLLKYNTHTKTNDYLDNIFSLGFLPLITKPTRITPASATLIDHIYTNNISQSQLSGIILTDVADHFGTFHIILNTPPCSTNEKFKKRSFSEINITKFKNDLDTKDFSIIKQTQCPNEAYRLFSTLYNDSYEKAFPLKETKINKKYIKREPWITTGLLASKRTKAKLFKNKLRNPSVSNQHIYKSFINMYNKLKTILKKDYYKSMLRKNKNNMKNTWALLKKAIGK